MSLNNVNLCSSYLYLSTPKDVAGGPFGIEPSIRAAGNFYAIIGKYCEMRRLKECDFYNAHNTMSFKFLSQGSLSSHSFGPFRRHWSLLNWARHSKTRQLALHGSNMRSGRIWVVCVVFWLGFLAPLVSDISVRFILQFRLTSWNASPCITHHCRQCNLSHIIHGLCN
jgi:hypothetical protein